MDIKVQSITFLFTLILPLSKIFLFKSLGEGRVWMPSSSERLFVASMSPSSWTNMSAMIALELIKHVILRQGSTVLPP